MVRRLPRVVLALLLACFWLVAPSPAAHAASDTVDRLDATYVVQRDGSVRVTHVLDYRFAGSGRHGIKFDIVQREPWGADPTQDVVYGISDISVTSPTGASTQVETSTTSTDSPVSVRLTIGDASKTVDSTETYQISWTLRGALRNFSPKQSELYFDVTSATYPRIDQYRLTVKAPGRITSPKCTHARSCDNGRAIAGGYQWSGTQPSGTLTFAVMFDKLKNDAPKLEPRQVTRPTLVAESTKLAVGTDGVVQANHLLTWVSPDAKPVPVQVVLPKRRPWGQREDAVYQVSDLKVVEGRTALAMTEKQPLTWRQWRDWRAWRDQLATSASVENTVWQGTTLAGQRVHRVAVSYRVTGATDDLTARSRLLWTPAIGLDHAGSPTVQVTVPKPVKMLRCLDLTSSGQDFCDRDGKTSTRGNTATWSPATVEAQQFVAVDAAKGAFTPTQVREPSKQLQRWLGNVLTGVGGLFVAWLGGAIGAWTPPRRGRDLRWISLPPGVMGQDGATIAPDHKPEIPVRFNPPDFDLHTVAAAMDAEPRPRHVAAVLTQMAVAGQLFLRLSPRRVERARPPAPGTMEQQIWELADAPAGSGPAPREGLLGVWDAFTMSRVDGPTDRRTLGRMADVVRHQVTGAQQRVVTHQRPSGGWLRPGLALGLGALVLAVAAAVQHFSSIFAGPRGWVVVALAVWGCLVGLNRARRKRRPDVRTAMGTMINDQAEGFKTYLTTVDAERLRFEERENIFTRYLPWAALFGVAEEWTRRCAAVFPQQVAAFACTDAVVRYSRDDDLPTSESQVIREEQAARESWRSSSDSGSSSSSDSFDSGGGGGGTSVSSW